MELEIKLRIIKEGEKIFGKGPLILLETIDKFGSLNKASYELNMSYSKAWSIINKAENSLGYPLLTTYTGGSHGGGSYLTPKAKKLMQAYKDFSEEAEESLKEIYKKHFRDI